MRGLDEKVRGAIAIDPSILVGPEGLEGVRGRSLEEMERLGLTKRDLKWLARHGLAVCAYTYNGQIEVDKDGRVQRRFLDGAKARWVLYAPVAKGEA